MCTVHLVLVRMFASIGTIPEQNPQNQSGQCTQLLTRYLQQRNGPVCDAVQVQWLFAEKELKVNRAKKKAVCLPLEWIKPVIDYLISFNTYTKYRININSKIKQIHTHRFDTGLIIYGEQKKNNFYFQCICLQNIAFVFVSRDCQYSLATFLVINRTPLPTTTENLNTLFEIKIHEKIAPKVRDLKHFAGFCSFAAAD